MFDSYLIHHAALGLKFQVEGGNVDAGWEVLPHSGMKHSNGKGFGKRTVAKFWWKCHGPQAWIRIIFLLHVLNLKCVNNVLIVVSLSFQSSHACGMTFPLGLDHWCFISTTWHKRYFILTILLYHSHPGILLHSGTCGHPKALLNTSLKARRELAIPRPTVTRGRAGRGLPAYSRPVPSHSSGGRSIPSMDRLQPKPSSHTLGWDRPPSRYTMVCNSFLHGFTRQG